MAGRVIWEGTVSFGLVAIPIKMVSAVDKNRVSFHLLRDENHARLERRMYCPKDETIVPEEHIVKGYEIEPDKFVTVTGEELESLSPERSDTIEIIEFVEERDIDPIYFDRTYYLIPSKGGTKPYNLLTSIMSDTSRLGISRFVLRDKEHLCAVKSIGQALCLFILHYHEEKIMADDIAPRLEADEADAVAAKILDRLREPFHLQEQDIL